jgi:hypothetical protein
VTERFRSIPVWGWLAAIVLVSFAARAWLARGMLGPFVMVDELIYSELAKSFADRLAFAVREIPTRGYGIVYPIAIAPAYLLFERVPDAYAAVKTINSLVMSLAAIPAYLVARRVVRPPLALLAAVLSVAIPSMVYTATVMTENVFYPVFLLAALLLVRMVERPTARAQVAFLAVVVLALLTRAQAIAIVPAALTAPLLLGVFGRTGLRAGLRPYRLLYAVVAGTALLAVAAQVARGRSLSSLLGAYSVVGEGTYDVGKALRYLVYHLAELDLYLGVIPVAVTIVLVGRSRTLDRPLQALLAVTLALTGWFAVVVATFASRFADRIQERNLFVVAPLFLVLLLAWVERGAPRPRYLAAAAAASALLVLAIPFETFITTSSVSDTLMLLPWWAVLAKVGIEWVPSLAVLLCVLFAAVTLVVPRRYAIALPLIVLAYWVVVLKPIWFGPYPYGVKQAGAGALFQGIRGAPRDWIDAAVPSGVSVAVLYTGRADRFTVNQNEFFNRSVGQVYLTAGPTPGGVGEIPVALGGPDGVVRLPDGSPLAPGYLLADGSVEPEGKAVARDLGLGMTVWRVDGPLVLASTKVTGVYDDRWSGPSVTWTRKQCRGGSLTVSLSGDATLFPEGQTVAASTGQSVRVAPNQVARLTVPVRPRHGVCAARFTVAPTAVPSEVLAGSTDDRVLGTHFTAFAYERETS